MQVIEDLRREQEELLSEIARGEKEKAALLRGENKKWAAERAKWEAEKIALQQEVKALKQKLDSAQDRIKELERTVARQTAPFRRPEQAKVPAAEKKRPGRRVGHPGFCRPRPAVVDQTIHVPLPACPQCGGAISDRTPILQYIEEIPPLRPTVTRLTTWKARCPQCGEVHSSHPLQTSLAQGAAGVQLGPRAAALAALLSKHLGLPARKTCAILKRGFGLSLTAGGLTQLLHRVAGKLLPQFQELRERVRHSDVNYMDETSWYVGEPQWTLWVTTSPEYTLYHVDPSHGGPVAEKLLGKEYSGVLVTDCFAAYQRFTCRQHKCIAHHLRALKEARGKNEAPASPYLDAWEGLWKGVIELTKLRDKLTECDFSQRLAAVETQVEELLASEVNDHGDRAFQTRMRRPREHLLGCLYYRVEATNNRAERAIRPAVVARKISCGNKTLRGATTWEILVSLAETARQTGRDFLADVTTALMLSPPVLVG